MTPSYFLRFFKNAFLFGIFYILYKILYHITDSSLYTKIYEAMEEFNFTLDEFLHFETIFGAKIEKDIFLEYVQRFGNHACFELVVKCETDIVEEPAAQLNNAVSVGQEKTPESNQLINQSTNNVNSEVCFSV